ncbi:MAG: hypothetical protein FWC89_08515 [Defluviitaleaceae bacterium]|nr:hypothetical protein [Defluviitaleaceae bacterium]
MKRILFFVLGLIVFVGCGTNEVEDSAYVELVDEIAYVQEEDLGDSVVMSPVDEPSVRGRGPRRGVWDGNVYVSRDLGIWFYMPQGWLAYGDLELLFMSENVNITAADVWAETGDWGAFFDLVALDMDTGVMIFIEYQTLLPNQTEAEFLREMLTMGVDMGYYTSAEMLPYTMRIGFYNWHMMSTEMLVDGEIRHSRYFVHILNGFARMIIISHCNTFDAPVEIIETHFGNLENIPEPSWEPQTSW